MPYVLTCLDLELDRDYCDRIPSDEHQIDHDLVQFVTLFEESWGLKGLRRAYVVIGKRIAHVPGQTLSDATSIDPGLLTGYSAGTDGSVSYNGGDNFLSYAPTCTDPTSINQEVLPAEYPRVSDCMDFQPEPLDIRPSTPLLGSQQSDLKGVGASHELPNYIHS